MAEITEDQLVEAAKGLGKTEFSRDDLAGALNKKKSELKEAVKEARQSGRIEKVRDDEDGNGVFALSG